MSRLRSWGPCNYDPPGNRKGVYEAARASTIDLYDLPLLPSWHTLLVAE